MREESVLLLLVNVVDAWLTKSVLFWVTPLVQSWAALFRSVSNDDHVFCSVEFGIGGNDCACVTAEASFWQAAATVERVWEDTAAGNAVVSEPMSVPNVVTVVLLVAAHFAVPTTPVAMLVVDVVEAAVVELLDDELVEHPANANPATTTPQIILHCMTPPVPLRLDLSRVASS